MAFWRWIKRVLLAVIALVLFFSLYLFFPREIEQAKSITWGVTFTKSYAEYLGLDWKQAYLEILDDLKVKSVRIGINWDEIESTRGRFDFADYDWMIDEAAKRNVTVLPTIGFKLPRWPECRAPQWAQTWLPESRPLWKRMLDLGAGPQRPEFEKAQLEMMATVVQHFQGRINITAWQIENEGFIGWFGDCPPIPDAFVHKEVELVRSLDSRPILMTESGELSFGLRSAVVADVVGTSLYRKVWSPTFGYITYPLPPSFYTRKGRLLRPWAPRFIITELQLEVWAPDSIINVPIEEQLRMLTPEEFRSTIDYARRTGIDEIYAWGVEWWWRLKIQGYPQLWEAAREEFVK
ncbi:MAG: Beta-xylosidase [Parcubacteria group bacterium GW2011_GWA2_47_26]|nr:MAG: Beta-xylosidase [Parcubacteria group bacterium GW2011_GWA2_47_26]